MRYLRLHYDAEHGVMIDVPFALPEWALKTAIEKAIPKQIDRYRTLPAGPKRDELKSVIEKMQAGQVHQNVVGSRGDGKGDIVLFNSDKARD